MTCQIRVGDIGTIFRVTIIDCDTGLPIDVSAATTLTIKFLLPDLSVLEKSAVFTTAGVDGKIQYVTIDGDLSQPGRWKIQGFVVDSGYSNHSVVEEFNVLSNLN